MATRKIRPHALLHRHIRSHIQSQRLCLRKSPLFLSLSLFAVPPLALIPVSVANAQSAAEFLWDCHPGNNDAEWSCRQIERSGPAYKRPAHRNQQSPVNTPTAVVSYKLDWVPQEELSAEQQKEIESGCCGAYIEPERTDDEASLDPQDAPLRASADKAEWLQETTTVMEGNVRLTQGSRQLKADRVTLDNTTNIANVEGNISLREPNLLLVSEKARVNTNSKYATLQDAEFVMHDTRVRGTAGEIEHLENNTLILKDGAYTRCEPDSTAWLLKGTEITLDPNTETGKGKHVRLEVKGIPVFYAPYLQFPLGNQRDSGFLFPFISTSDSGDGLNFGIPYYFNLAPDYDLTATPRHIDGRGDMLETEFRHLSPRFETILNVAFLGNDDGGEDSDDEKLLEDAQRSFNQGNITQQQLTNIQESTRAFEGEDRWLFNIDQKGGLSERWNTQIDFTKVSDIDYFRDLDTASLSVNSETHLKRLGLFSYRTDNWLYSIKAEEYQTLAENLNQPFRQSPRLNADGDYRLGNWELTLDHELVSFSHRDKDANITGERVRIDYEAQWDKEWLWGFFRPGVMVKHLSYQLDDNIQSGIDDNPSVSVPQGNLDMGLYFERDGTLLGDSYLQTFEPRIFYFYSDFEDQSEMTPLRFDTSELTFSYGQLFRTTRFSGGDRIDDANQLSVGLTTRFIETQTGIERLSLSLGQIYYFDERAVTLSGITNVANNSEIAAQIKAQIADSWQLNSSLQYDEEQQLMTRGNFSLRYRDDRFRLFNIDYRFVRSSPTMLNGQEVDTDIEQASTSFLWPVYGDWSLIGRYNKDFTNDRDLEKFAGFEYNSCCYRVRVLWRRWLDNDLANIIDDSLLEFDEGVFFEFQFKGLGGTGSTVNKVLSEGIYGYDRREEVLE